MDDSVDGKFETMWTMWLIESCVRNICLISGYSYFQLFEEQSKVEMQGEDKDFWESLNAFAMSDNKSSDNKSHLHTITCSKNDDDASGKKKIWGNIKWETQYQMY